MFIQEKKDEISQSTVIYEHTDGHYARRKGYSYFTDRRQSAGHRLHCFSTPIPDTDPTECKTEVIKSHEQADALFCSYVAENIARQTGQRTLCTGGVFVDDPDEHQMAKLYENIDEMIRDWANFYTD